MTRSAESEAICRSLEELPVNDTGGETQQARRTKKTKGRKSCSAKIKLTWEGGSRRGKGGAQQSGLHTAVQVCAMFAKKASVDVPRVLQHCMYGTGEGRNALRG